MKVTKPIDLVLLEQELNAAGVTVAALGHSGTDSDGDVFTYQGASPVDLPPEAALIVNAHVAPPKAIEFAGEHAVDAMVRTTDDQPHQVFRFTTKPKHVYRATFRMTAIDAASGVTKDSEVRMTFRASANSLTQVGTTAVLYNVQNTGAAGWAIQTSVQFPDLIISVTGALGRTIDWLLTGNVGAYAPEGLSA